MTTEEQIARCGIWEERPQVCRDYPKIGHYRPEECTFAFIGNDRIGRCECNVGACCAVPREGGEPGGAPIPEQAGGLPCRHLVWRAPEEAEVKIASALPIVHDLGEMPVVYDFGEIMRKAGGSD